MHVSIREFTEKDIPHKLQWINDPKNNQYLHYDLPLEFNSTLAWLERNRGSSTRYDGVIEVDGEPVGLIGLLDIDTRFSKAEFYIVMGNPNFRGKGIALTATRKMLEMAFTKIGLNRVYLFTELTNINAQVLFIKAGFQVEGLLRQDAILNGQFSNRYAMSILKQEFIKETIYDIN
jgi:RimJ/RimL family protein N-acetyltransferase